MKVRVSVAAALLLAGCSGAPTSFPDANSAITEVKAAGDYLNLRIEQPSRVFRSSVVMEIGQIVTDAAEAIKAGVPGPTPETKFVSFDVRFGSPEAPDRFGSVVFPLDALKNVDDEVASDIRIMNLATSYDLGSGQSADDAVASCMEQSSFVAMADGFCSLVVSAAAGRALNQSM